MFNKKPKLKLRKEYDAKLLDAIDRAKLTWDQAKQTEEAIYEVDAELSNETQMARARYFFLYNEARVRAVKGHMQASVIAH
ncbi:YaaL family protein [Dellaglioa sp. BT-FLS60]